jgi:hypothetical protein
VLDASDPGHPLLLSNEIRTFGLVQDLFYDRGTQRLYLACGEGGLGIWDLVDPSAPERLSVTEVLYYDVETPVRNVDVYAHFAIVECAWGYVHSLDVTDPSQPIHVSYHGGAGNPCHDLHVSQKDGQAHTTGAQNYQRLYIREDGVLIGSGSKHFTYGPYAVFGIEEVGFVGYSGVLHLVDLLSPGWPVWSTINLDGISDLVVQGGYAYAINDENLNIVDVHEYSAPSLASSLPIPRSSELPIPRSSERLAIASNRVYVASADSGLSIVDVSDPSAPTILGRFYVSSLAW